MKTAGRKGFTPLETCKRRRSLTGFTFIELTIAVTIFSVIAVSIYSVFNAGLRTWKRTSPIIEENQATRFFFDIIAKDLKSAICYKNNPDYINFDGESQRISFWALVEVLGENNAITTELAKVTYFLETEPVKPGAKSTGAKVIARNVATILDGFKENPEKTEQLISGVKENDFGFEFCYKEPGSSQTEYAYIWDKDEWNDKTGKKSVIPRGVRIRLGTLTKTVFIPTGELGER